MKRFLGLLLLGLAGCAGSMGHRDVPAEKEFYNIDRVIMRQPYDFTVISKEEDGELKCRQIGYYNGKTVLRADVKKGCPMYVERSSEGNVIHVHGVEDINGVAVSPDD